MALPITLLFAALFGALVAAVALLVALLAAAGAGAWLALRASLLWGGAALVLGIGAVSLTNLVLVRAQGRLRELATRFVLGASRGRLVRQLATESAVVVWVPSADWMTATTASPPSIGVNVNSTLEMISAALQTFGFPGESVARFSAELREE